MSKINERNRDIDCGNDRNKRRKLNDGRYQVTTILNNNDVNIQRYKIIEGIIDCFNIDIRCPIHDISKIYCDFNIEILMRNGMNKCVKCYGCNNAITGRIESELIESILKHENGYQFWEYLCESEKIYYPKMSSNSMYLRNNDVKRPKGGLIKNLLMPNNSVLCVKLPDKIDLPVKIEYLSLRCCLSKHTKNNMEIYLVASMVDRITGKETIICDVNLFRCSNVDINGYKLKITVLTKDYNKYFNAPNCVSYKEEHNDLVLIFQCPKTWKEFKHQRNEVQALFQLVQIIHQHSSKFC